MADGLTRDRWADAWADGLMQVLTASIVKLGKLMPAVTVYRAPGGVLPPSFWVRDADQVVRRNRLA